MKRSLRVTLLSILLSLALFTVLMVGGSGYKNLQDAEKELIDEILRQTVARVEQRVEEITRTGQRQSSIMQHLFRAGEFDPDEFYSLASYWHEIVESIPVMSGMFYIRAEDGAAVFVMRSPIYNRITVREVVPAPGRRQLRTSSIRDFRARFYREPAGLAARLVGLQGGLASAPLVGASTLFPWQNDPATQSAPLDFDVRALPSFVGAHQAGHALWTDTYMFFGEEGTSAYPGLSHATPLFRPDGSLRGVLGVSFNLFTLCDFLRDLDDSTKGFPFIVEQRRDGQRRLIAHPERARLLESRSDTKIGFHVELLPLEKIGDQRIRAFMEQVGTDVEPGRVREIAFEQDAISYLGGYRAVQSSLSSPSWVVGVVLPRDEIGKDAHDHIQTILIVSVVVLLIAVVLSFLTAGQVAHPLEELVKDTEKIARLDLEPGPGTHSIIYEVDRLASATEAMKTSLRSFRKYVPADLVARLLASGQEANLGGEKRRLTIYFSDIAGFTTISESMTPEKLVEHLGEYLQELSEQILAGGGTVDKYIGDAIMAFWGAPAELPAPALAACTAALRNQQTLARLRERWRAEGKPLFEARIGINTGDVIVGNIGSARRMNYTVIGDAVNLASRLEGLNKFYGTAILITEATYEEARAGIVARPLDWVSVKGKSAGVLVYELLGLAGETPAEKAELAELFGHGLMAYRRRSWAEAIALFDQILSRWPDDAPAREMRSRCLEYRDHPPGENWDGVRHMESK